MENKKWLPCFCTIIMGVLVIVFAWWQVAWAQTALTVVGVLVILKGIINKCCCCGDSKLLSSCCGGTEEKKEGGGGCCS